MSLDSNCEPKRKSNGVNAPWNRDEFLAMISHEIRNSTQIIISWAELLGRQADSDETTLRGLEVIRRSGRLQTKLLNQLLAFSSKPDGDFSLDARQVALVPILESAIKTMTAQALAKRIELSADLKPSVYLIIGDAGQLEEVFTNILSNAIKFTPVGGRVDVRLRCSKGCAEITVTDTGQGISPDFLPHVFDRFSQESGKASGHDGLGLGLAITKYLVERHRGKILALSPGRGQGATFRVVFPLAYDASAERQPARTGRSRSRTRVRLISSRRSTA